MKGPKLLLGGVTPILLLSSISASYTLAKKTKVTRIKHPVKFKSKVGLLRNLGWVDAFADALKRYEVVSYPEIRSTERQIGPSI